MIASLQGRLQHKDADGAVVECGGVGYGVAMSLSSLSQLGSEGSDVQLLVHTHVSQDSLRLYGFVEASERRAFEVLIATSGVGPRLALAVLSTFSPEELSDTVARKDTASLVRIPGIGKKKAERLVLELRDRLPAATLLHAPGATPGTLQADLNAALVGLGFSESVAQDACQSALASHPNETDLATLVREALRQTTRRP